MVCHKKRGFAVTSAIFTLLYSVVMFVTSALIFVARLLGRLNDNTGNEYSLLEDLGFNELREYLSSATDMEHTLIVVGTVVFLALSILTFVLVLKMFKSPVLEDGTVTYRPGRLFLVTLFATIGAAAGALAGLKEGMAGISQILCFAIAGLGGLGFIFAIISIFPKKNVFKTKVIIEKKKNQKFSPVVLGVEEKLKKIQQLKDVGAITEAQYNAAVIRLINSI